MRALAVGLCLLSTLAMAVAQDAPKQSGDSPHSTGRTVSPETDGKQQPQGDTGPLNTRPWRRSDRIVCRLRLSRSHLNCWSSLPGFGWCSAQSSLRPMTRLGIPG
jgi:hypothetical protein